MSEAQHKEKTIGKDKPIAKPLSNAKPGRGGVVLATAGPGRPAGVRNRLTAARDAILASFEQVGGVEYLNRLANGTQSDRQAYISLLKHILPSYTHIAADLQGGGLQVQLNWLQVRQIGTPMAQPAIEQAQVIDAIDVSATEQRITDALPTARDDGQAAADPPPPMRSGGGGPA